MQLLFWLPKAYRPLASWFTGWSNWVSQITGSPSINSSLASMILAVVSIYEPSHEALAWHTFLLTLTLTISQAILSSMPTRAVARFNSYGSIFNVGAILAVVVVIGAQDWNPIT